MSAYSALFSPINVGGYQFKNRLVALPVYTGYAYPDGRVSSYLIEHYKSLAKSGVAMVVVANASVAPDGITSTYNLRTDKDEFIPGLARLAKGIKQQGALACLQLNHAGRFAKTDQPLLPASFENMHLSFNVTALKDFMNFFPLEKRFRLTRHFLKQASTWRRAMTAEDREKVVAGFAEAAYRAYTAGFDMIELHGANGYLLCQFLSSFTNKTPSDFGGNFSNRSAFPLLVVREIKKRLPDNFPVGFRLMIREYVPDGIDLREAIAFARLLEAEGISYLSASAGSYNSIFNPEVRKQMTRPGYLGSDMMKLTCAVHIPTIISGRVITPSLANELINKKAAELIGLGRPLRADMNWLTKAASDSRKITRCVNCNWCIKRVVLEQGFNCKRWPRLLQEKTDLEHSMLTRNYKGLWVIAEEGDLELYQTALPPLLPDSQHFSIPISPTILFLEKGKDVQFPHTMKSNFLKWGRTMLANFGFPDGLLTHVEKVVKEAYDEEVHSEIRRGSHGVIIIGRNPEYPWKERLLYKERHKVMALIGSNDHPSDILVPVDLSKTTLLIMMYLRQTYLYKPGFRLNFIHVLKGSEAPVAQQWKRYLEITGLNANLPLEMISSTGDVVETLLETIHTGKYGTIIMGKRGLSGIKRWWLGSVSAGVLNGLTDQSLFLVD